MKSNIYYYLAYSQLRIGELEKSAENFLSSLKLDSNPNTISNFAYVQIRLGRANKVGQMIEEAFEGMYDPGYAHRNAALYHRAMGNASQAEEHFQNALEADDATDLLEYHYAEFLLEQEQKEKAMIYLQKAIEKGESAAIKLHEKLTK